MTKCTASLYTMAVLTALAGGCGDDDDGGSDVVDSGSTSDAGRSDAGGSTSDAGRSDAGATDSGAADAGTADKTITELVVATDDFSTLESAVITAELADTLSGPGPFTVFAPTNAAFSAALTELGLSASDLTKELLTPILQYHVLASEALAADLETGPVKTVSGLSAWLDVGTSVKVNAATVTSADIKAKNGVIHVIDKVLLPPDIVAFAGYAGFTSLTGAVTSAGLVETLQGDGPFTVFAPTNAAFAALASVPTGDALKNVLLYHVVPGKVLSSALTAGAVPTALTGKSVTIALPASGPTVNGAKIAPADLEVTNGVIHVVDKVLVPPS